MNVTFTRTAERRYRVSVAGPGVVSAEMDPAPGYDPRLPHDMAHFVVENELGMSGGIFGQLAQGGHARTFRPIGEPVKSKIARRGNRVAAANRQDAMLSEKMVYLTCLFWNNALAELPPGAGVKIEDVQRVCRTFDAVSAVWSKLRIGESMTLEWRGSAKRNRQVGSSNSKRQRLKKR